MTEPKFLDLPASFYPFHVLFEDLDTNEVLAEYHTDGPGVLTGGGFGKGRRMKMTVTYGDGVVDIVEIDDRKAI